MTALLGWSASHGAFHKSKQPPTMIAMSRILIISELSISGDQQTTWLFIKYNKHCASLIHNAQNLVYSRGRECKRNNGSILRLVGFIFREWKTFDVLEPHGGFAASPCWFFSIKRYA